MNYKKIKSPIGNLHLYADESNLIGVLFDQNHSNIKKLELSIVSKTNDIIDKTEQQLKEYFNGKRKEFNLPIKTIGTDFQNKSWNTLLLIPFGKTISYQDQSNLMKKSKASRAIGSSNGKNLISIIIPCHRVINKSGSLGGYAGGLVAKQYLLSLEKKQS